MSPEETRELQRDAHDLAYQAILFSGLYKGLKSNEQWDALAAQWGKEAVDLIQQRIDGEFTRLESARDHEMHQLCPDGIDQISHH